MGIAEEKEYAQVVGGIETEGLTKRQVFSKVLKNPNYHYLMRDGLAWIMRIGGQEVYELKPRYESDFHLLVESFQPEVDSNALDAVIGTNVGMPRQGLRGAPLLPVVRVHQIYTFTKEHLIKGIPGDKKSHTKEFNASAHEVLNRILAFTENLGNTDCDRAKNWIALRSPYLYKIVAECHGRDLELARIECRPHPLSGARNLVDLLLRFESRGKEFGEKYRVILDMTDALPFQVSPFERYYA